VCQAAVRFRRIRRDRLWGLEMPLSCRRARVSAAVSFAAYEGRVRLPRRRTTRPALLEQKAITYIGSV
jgi:hypothetical protein